MGANAKMNEFCAIMGLCNLQHIREVLEERKKRDQYYRNAISKIKGIRLFEEQMDVQRNYAYFPMIVEDDYSMSRDELYDVFKENGIYARKYFYPITADQACFRNKYKKDDLANARKLSEQILTIPFYDTLDFEVMDRIINILH